MRKKKHKSINFCIYLLWQTKLVFGKIFINFPVNNEHQQQEMQINKQRVYNLLKNTSFFRFLFSIKNHQLLSVN